MLTNKQTEILINSICESFLYKDDQLVCNDFMKHNAHFLLNILYSTNDSKEAVLIHPGVDRLLPLAILVLSILSIVDADKIDVADFFSQFQVGDMVVRNGTRYHYNGTDNTYCYLLSDDTSRTTNTTDKIPLRGALNIRQYRGQAITTGRARNSQAFLRVSKLLKGLLGNEYSDRIDVLPRCLLVLCDSEEAESIATQLTTEISGEQLKFADIFPCVWARSEDDWTYYCGNVGKAEPVVIFSNRVHIARDIMFNDEDDTNRVFATIVSDTLSQATEQDILDLRDLIERKDKGNFWLFQSESNLSALQSYQKNPTSPVLFWTPELLLSTISDLYSPLQSQAAEAINTILRTATDCNVERKAVACPTPLEQLKECKHLLKKLIRKHAHNETEDEFILCAYGLLNLFEQACFPMHTFEAAVEHELIRARSPKAQITRLYILADQIQEHEMHDQIAILLDEAYEYLCQINPKYAVIKSILLKAEQNNTATCIIVTKKAYLPIMQDLCSEYSGVSVKVISEPILESTDQIIYTSTPNPKKGGANPLYDRRAKSIIVLEYPSEQAKNHYYQNNIRKDRAHIQAAADECARTFFDIDLDENTGFEAIDEETADVEAVETDLANIETEAIIRNVVFQGNTNTGNTPIKVIRLGQFATGECVMFSRHYKAYVIQNDALVEKRTADLVPGDELVFSAASTEMSDIIDVLLKRLVKKSNDSIFREHYDRSVRWKAVIQSYIQQTGATWAELAEAMEQLGHKRHPQTIRHWLDEDGSTVGPHDAEAYLAIGLVAEDADMQDNYVKYKESCDYIRRQRTRILNYLQDSAIHSVNRKADTEQSLSRSEIASLGDYSRYAQQLIIERIVPCEREVPAYLANRPLERR